jgi:predicted DNA-binding protein with PD1-like motif
MNVIPYEGAVEIVTIALGPGELLLEGIQDAIKRHDIQNGAVVSGVATLRKYRAHYITRTDVPPKDVIYTLEKPLEVTCINGIIANGEPHLHITVTCGENETHGGHLESGNEVAYLAEIMVLKLNGHRLIRRPDPSGYLKMLQAE